MVTAVFTPTRNPGIAVSYYSVARQVPAVDHWLVADQLAPERQWCYDLMRQSTPKLNIETYCAEILGENIGNLEHVHNWALRRARELKVDLLVFLQDFIWVPKDGVAKFATAARHHPFDLLTGNVSSSNGPKRDHRKAYEQQEMWSILEGSTYEKPPEPYTPDTRIQMGWRDHDQLHGKYLNNHAWEINWGALPYALINAGVDFDEDYDKGTQWGNTQFSFNIRKKLKCGDNVWWDIENEVVSMPHREYFPNTHAGERDHDNGWRFWQKNPELKPVA